MKTIEIGDIKINSEYRSSGIPFKKKENKTAGERFVYAVEPRIASITYAVLTLIRMSN